MCPNKRQEKDQKLIYFFAPEKQTLIICFIAEG